MILEWFRSLFSPASAVARKEGFLSEAIAIDARYKRCREGWSGHLQSCRSRILEAVGHCSGRNSVVVLGAGAGHDLPLEQLSAEFRQVVLVDLVFLRPMRKKAEKLGNVRLVEADVTGFFDLSPDRRKSFLHSALSGSPQREMLSSPEIGSGFDLVVSLNLMSQLPVMPLSVARELLKEGQELTSGEERAIARHLLDDHAIWLRDLGTGQLLVICDRWHKTLLEGEQTAKAHALWDYRLSGQGGVFSEWNWDIAPRPELDDRHDVQNVVQCWLGRAGDLALREDD